MTKGLTELDEEGIQTLSIPGEEHTLSYTMKCMQEGSIFISKNFLALLSLIAAIIASIWVIFLTYI